MLELRPNCECCGVDLLPAAPDARICSFECTFCANCAEVKLAGVCPNCGGGFTPRPIRPANKLAADPPSTLRVHKPASCEPRPSAPPASTRPRDIPAYSPRPIRFLRSVADHAWTIKVYSIAAGPGPADPTAVDAAVKLALAHLHAAPRPCAATCVNLASLPSHGLAFLIVHQARDAIFAVLETWFGGSMLRHEVWIAPLSQVTRFESATSSGLNVCVWELAVLEHERRAWLRWMLTPGATSDRAAYLADVLNADV